MLITKRLSITIRITMDGTKVRLYITRYSVRRTAQSALHFSPWQTFSVQRHLYFAGSISPLVTARRLFFHISTTEEKESERK